MGDANREPCLAYLEALLERELAADASSSSVERLRCGGRAAAGAALSAAAGAGGRSGEALRQSVTCLAYTGLAARCMHAIALRKCSCPAPAAYRCSMPPTTPPPGSIALGAVELALTPRDQSKASWPADLPATVDSLAAVFDGFVEGLAGSPALAGAPSPAAKVKAVADAVWAKLQKGYSKDLQHAQVWAAAPNLRARMAALRCPLARGPAGSCG